MGWGGLRCYICHQPTALPTCMACQAKLMPTMAWLPSLPGICLGASFYDYNAVVKRVIQEVKFHGNHRLGQRLANAMGTLAIPPIFLDSDAIVAVPSHWLRQWWRGRPHIPRLFGPLLRQHQRGISPYLVRRRYTRPSIGLSRQDRLRKGHHFGWRGPNHMESVTLLDDVCTTGATLTALAQLLKYQGIATVKALVIAHVDTQHINRIDVPTDFTRHPGGLARIGQLRSCGHGD